MKYKKEYPMIQPIKNTFLVTIDKEAESKVTLSNGVELYIDREFGEQSTTLQQESELYNYYRELEAEYSKLHEEWVTASKKGLPVVALRRRMLQIEAEQNAHKTNKIIKPYSNVVQHGIVQQIPRKVDARVKKYDKGGRPYYDGYFNDVQIEIGDKVYFHHFVGDKENEIDVDGRVYYKADMSHIFAVIKDGQIIPTEKWILASPVMETDDDIMTKVGDVVIYKKLSAEKKFMLSRVEASSAQALSAKYFPGDVIMHPLFSEYALKVEGKDMYRMHLDDIFSTVKGFPAI